jgi:hypothetical protein
MARRAQGKRQLCERVREINALGVLANVAL